MPITSNCVLVFVSAHEVNSQSRLANLLVHISAHSGGNNQALYFYIYFFLIPWKTKDWLNTKIELFCSVLWLTKCIIPWVTQYGTDSLTGAGLSERENFVSCQNTPHHVLLILKESIYNDPKPASLVWNPHLTSVLQLLNHGSPVLLRVDAVSPWWPSRKGYHSCCTSMPSAQWAHQPTFELKFKKLMLPSAVLCV